MDTWTRIERGGFYPKAVQRALRRALGSAEPLATLCQVDTGFDRGSVFRHLTIASLTDRAIVQLHVDEMDGGSATIATAVHCDDPNCMADHGLTGSSFPDDLTFRISAAADGRDALDEALAFVDRLAQLMGTHSE